MPTPLPELHPAALQHLRTVLTRNGVSERKLRTMRTEVFEDQLYRGKRIIEAVLKFSSENDGNVMLSWPPEQPDQVTLINFQLWLNVQATWDALGFEVNTDRAGIMPGCLVLRGARLGPDPQRRLEVRGKQDWLFCLQARGEELWLNGNVLEEGELPLFRRIGRRMLGLNP